MRIISTWIGCASACVTLAACGGPMDPAGEDPAAVLAARAGTYEGSWELFGRAADGTVFSASTWTDVAVAAMPTFEDTRAYLRVTDALTFTGGMQFMQEWIEGVLVEADGTAGQEFIETAGVVTLVEEVEPDHFRYETAVTPEDLYFFEGITPDVLVAGTHVLDKVVTRPGGVETHAITRTTHLEWMDATGALQTADLVTLMGTHAKTE